MPIGPYKNWAACISAQVSKGYKKDVAEKICGKIESNKRKKHEREKK